MLCSSQNLFVMSCRSWNFRLAGFSLPLTVRSRTWSCMFSSSSILSKQRDFKITSEESTFVPWTENDCTHTVEVRHLQNCEQCHPYKARSVRHFQLEMVWNICSSVQNIEWFEETNGPLIRHIRLFWHTKLDPVSRRQYLYNFFHIFQVPDAWFFSHLTLRHNLAIPKNDGMVFHFPKYMKYFSLFLSRLSTHSRHPPS
jgi:hypothetical protein